MSNPLNVTMTVRLRVPAIPNFISVEGDREMSFNIRDIPDDKLKQIGEAWTAELMNKARLNRAAPPLAVKA